LTLETLFLAVPEARQHATAPVDRVPEAPGWSESDVGLKVSVRPSVPVMIVYVAEAVALVVSPGSTASPVGT
jgi:hypothetical protein